MGSEIKGISAIKKFNGKPMNFADYEVDLSAGIAMNGCNGVAALEDAAIGRLDASKDADAKQINKLAILYSLIILTISSSALKRMLQQKCKKDWGHCGATALRLLKEKYNVDGAVDSIDSIYGDLKACKLKDYGDIDRYLTDLDMHFGYLESLGETVSDAAQVHNAPLLLVVSQTFLKDLKRILNDRRR